MNAETLKYYSHPKMQEKFRKAIGPLDVRDWIWCLKCQGAEILCVHSEYCDEEIDNLLYLPLPIDPQNPSRGLWGMVDWTVFSENKRVLNDGQLHLSFGNSEYIGGPPELALLKVLAHQWGIEIEVEK